jgi:hypothetical protein
MKAIKWLKHSFVQFLAGLQAIGEQSPLPSLPNSPLPTLPKSSPPPIPASTAKRKSANRIALLATIAERELGKKETRNNVGKDVRKYQAATNLDPGAWPWCAAFCAWTLQQWLDDPANVKWLGLRATTPAKWRPKTALAYGFIKWAQARPATCTVLPDTAEPKAGDLVVYDFSHIGIVKESRGNQFVAIEGNTSGVRADGTPSREGDGVYLKVRPRKLARCFIRIRPRRTFNSENLIQ